MKASLPLLLLAATPPPTNEMHGADMDRIEAHVVLPPGAANLSNYARYYAPDKRGYIVGVYTVPDSPIEPDGVCEELTDDMKAQPCAPDWRDEEDAKLAGKLRANQRRWVEQQDLPMIFDGGCSVITVIYDPKVEEIRSVACNGVA